MCSLQLCLSTVQLKEAGRGRRKERGKGKGKGGEGREREKKSAAYYTYDQTSSHTLYLSNQWFCCLHCCIAGRSSGWQCLRANTGVSRLSHTPSMIKHETTSQYLSWSFFLCQCLCQVSHLPARWQPEPNIHWYCHGNQGTELNTLVFPW